MSKYNISVISYKMDKSDYLVYSFDSSSCHYRYNHIKVYCSLETDEPNFNENNYIFIGCRHLLFSQYLTCKCSFY